MKRSHLVLALCPSLLLLVGLAGSCSSEGPGGTSKKPVSTFDPNVKDAGAGGAEGGGEGVDAAMSMDAAALDTFREVKNVAQALQVLITAYDLEAKEGEIGKREGSTPPVKAFSADVVEEAKAGKARFRQLAANKDLTPATSQLNDRMKFESQASISHLKHIFKDMFNETFVSRRIDAASSLLRLIDDELTPLLAEDDDLKEELAATRDETEKRRARAEAVRGGLMDGPGSDDGMFPEPDDPAPEPEPEAAADAGAPAEGEAPADPARRALPRTPTRR